MVFGVVGIWPLVVVPGFVVLERYANTAGKPAEPPSTWPATVDLPRTAGRPTLVMLAHPRCPCTRSSLGELARLMAAVGGRADAWVLFVDPAGTDWSDSDLWAQARAIPGVQVRADPGSVTSAAFGAYTSGQVVVYDAAGALAFTGGITAGRGHEGDNVGRTEITELLVHGVAPTTASSVYGCELREPGGER
jgi:hypothetical protein